MNENVSQTNSDHGPNLTKRWNDIVISVFYGIAAGFVFAIYLGAFSASNTKDIPAWLQGISATGSLLLSIAGLVVLVGTLRATRETLSATRQMLSEQRRSGYSQIRPYVLLRSSRLDNTTSPPTIHLVLKNYGHTPALRLAWRFSFVDSQGFEDDHRETAMKGRTAYLPQKEELEYSFQMYLGDGIDPNRFSLSMWWGYNEFDDRHPYSHSISIPIYRSLAEGGEYKMVQEVRFDPFHQTDKITY